MRFVPKTLFLYAIVCFALTSQPALAVVVSADTNGGYGGQVLDILLQSWVRPEGASGSTSVLVRITTDGRPFSCELRKSSGIPVVDDSICLAVAKAGIFPPAPMGMPAEVALTFVFDTPGMGSSATPASAPNAVLNPADPVNGANGTDPASVTPQGATPDTTQGTPAPLPLSPVPFGGASPAPALANPALPASPAPSSATASPAATSYSETIMANARPYVEIPQGLTGEYTAIVSLTISPNGSVLESKMEKPSGSSAFDAAILRALLTPGVIVPPFDSQQQHLFLNFAFKTQ